MLHFIVFTTYMITYYLTQANTANRPIPPSSNILLPVTCTIIIRNRIKPTIPLLMFYPLPVDTGCAFKQYHGHGRLFGRRLRLRVAGLTLCARRFQTQLTRNHFARTAS